MMTRFWAAAILIACVCGLIPGAGLGQQAMDRHKELLNPPKPRMVCTQPTYRFGVTNSDAVITHTFMLMNQGTGLLEIKRVRSSCDCTSTKLTLEKIPPGGTSQLTATLNLGGRSGIIQKTVRVYSNDPSSPVQTMSFLGTAVQEIEMTPTLLFFKVQKEKLDQTYTKEIQVRFKKETNRVARAVCNLPFVNTAIHTMDPGRHDRVEVILGKPPQMRNDLFNGEIELFDPAENSLGKVTVRGQLVQSVIVMPSVIEIKKNARKPVSVHTVRALDFKGLKIEGYDTPADMQVKVFPIRDSYMRVHIENIQFSQALLTNRVVLHTNHDVLKQIEIPFKLKQ